MRPDEAAIVGIAVLDALCAAHAAGVLHRDVKPGNVLLADDGRVVLTDFGLATFDEIGSALTQSGIVHGSPQFIAPERALDGTSTVEADMWSLGATLFAAVEGQSPYARSTSYQTLAALATAPPDAPKRAGALKPVLAGLLRRKPSSRMKPDEIRSRLQRVANGESGRVRFPRQRHPNPSTAGGPPADVVLPRVTAEPNPPRRKRERRRHGDSGTRHGDDAGEAAEPRAPRQTERWRSAPGHPCRHRSARRIATAIARTTGRTDGIGPPRPARIVTRPVIRRPATPRLGEAAVAAESYRGNGRAIEWRNANGDVVRSSSGTKEELDGPPGQLARRMRRWAVPVAVIAVLLAGGAFVAVRQFGHSAATAHLRSPAPARLTRRGRSRHPGRKTPPASNDWPR